MMVNCKMIQMPAFAGEYGQLNAIEGGKDIPFDVQRVYYITGVPKGVTRGFHSHRKLLVLASRHYTEADYIRDYEQYLQEAEEYFKRGGVQK